MSSDFSRCEALEEHLVALALGLLTGRERAEALAHLEDCARSADELEQLARAADTLLEVVPEAEPPVGFEVRALDRLGFAARRRSPSRARVLFAAAAAAIALAGIGLGYGIGHPSTQAPSTGAEAIGFPPDPGAQTAELLVAGRPRGEVLIYPGSPGWLLMAVNGLNGDRDVICTVTTNQGRTITVGTFWMSRGNGGWSAVLPVRAGSIRWASLQTRSGQTLATARFRA